MSTRLQKKLARAIIEDAKNLKPSPANKLLESVGYSRNTANVKQREILDSVGLRNELNELGFSEDGAKKVVAEILYSKKAKDQDRLNAADKVFKVHGSYAAEKHVNVNMDVEPTEEIKEAARILNELYGK